MNFRFVCFFAAVLAIGYSPARAAQKKIPGAPPVPIPAIGAARAAPLIPAKPGDFSAEPVPEAAAPSETPDHQFELIFDGRKPRKPLTGCVGCGAAGHGHGASNQLRITLPEKPSPKQLIAFLKAALPLGAWQGEIPGGGKRRGDGANVSAAVTAGSGEAYPESVSLKIFYESDRKFNWFGLGSGVGSMAAFVLRDAPGSKVTRFQLDAGRITIDTRKDDQERRHYGYLGHRYERLILNLSEAGKVIGMTIENKDFLLSLFKTTRSALWDPAVVAQPWVSLD